MTRRLVAAICGTALALALAGTTLAGQPGAECGEDGAEQMPAGFATAGFANAETRYAGSDGTPSLLNANSDHAVSQYDVACLQVTTHRH
jgi:putative intracellular protease/amidase